MPYRQLKEKTLDILFRATRFSKNELEALFTMYRKLVTAAQNAAPATVIGQPVAKVDTIFIHKSVPAVIEKVIFGVDKRNIQPDKGIDQNTFRDVMHNTFDLVTEDVVMDRVWLTWERGANGGEGALKFEAWARGLSVLLRGSDEERRSHCFAVYDLNGDGFITRDEMFILLKVLLKKPIHGDCLKLNALSLRPYSIIAQTTNSLLKQPGDEDPDEGVRELVELVLRKMDLDNDGKLSVDDYSQAVQQEPLLLEAFGQCLPSKRHAAAFLKNLNTK